MTPVKGFIDWAYKAITDHEAFAGLCGIALILNMPLRLPPPLCNVAILEWSWEWARGTGNTVISFKSPPTIASRVDSETTIHPTALGEVSHVETHTEQRGGTP